jgi:hypothetical protein
MSGVGSKSLGRYIATGEQLTKTNAIKAKCSECMVNYIDGRYDCEITACPLHPFMPYRGKKAKIETNLVESGVVVATPFRNFQKPLKIGVLEVEAAKLSEDPGEQIR